MGNKRFSAAPLHTVTFAVPADLLSSLLERILQRQL